MSDITELERRITAALKRIGEGLEQIPATSAASGAAPADATREPDQSTIALTEELEAERTANAQLTERVRAIKEKQETTIGHQSRILEEQRGKMERLEAEVAKLHKVNDQLRSSNAALREANENGVGEPHLINKAMLTELEALRAMRAADRAELDAILDELQPLVGGDA